MAHDHVASSSVAPNCAVVGLADVLSCTSGSAHLLAQAGQSEKGISRSSNVLADWKEVNTRTQIMATHNTQDNPERSMVNTKIGINVKYTPTRVSVKKTSMDG